MKINGCLAAAHQAYHSCCMILPERNRQITCLALAIFTAILAIDLFYNQIPFQIKVALGALSGCLLVYNKIFSLQMSAFSEKRSPVKEERLEDPFGPCLNKAAFKQTSASSPHVKRCLLSQFNKAADKPS